MDEGRIRKIIHIDMDAFYASLNGATTGSDASTGDRRLYGEEGGPRQTNC